MTNPLPGSPPCLPGKGLILLLALAGIVLSVSSHAAFAREGSQKISPVCSTPEFVEFLEAFVLVPKQEQMSCVRFSDFTYKGKRISSPAQLVKSEAAATKLMFSRQEINATDRADPKFFYTLPLDMSRQGPAFNHCCYVIREEGSKRFVSLTVGGTFPLETVAFDWDGSHWRVTDVIQEEVQ